MADDLQRVIRLDVNATQALAQLDKIAKSTQNVDKGMQSMSSRLVSGIESVQKVVGVLAAGFATFKGLKAITDAGDQVRQLEGTFNALLGSATRAKDMLSEVFNVAQTTGAGLTDVASATQRLTIALTEAGATNAQIAQLAENFIKIGRIGGSSMEDTTGALVQFTQALASGKLQGDELRSILERVPLVAQAIAKELNVSVGALKQMGADGKLTADVLVNALLKPTEEIASRFAELPITMEQAWNRVATTGAALLAHIDTVAGISNTVAQVFAYIAELLEGIDGSLGKTGEELGTWQTIITGIGNGFRGVVIVVNTLVAGIAQALVSLKGFATLAGQAANPSEWKNMGQTIRETTDQVMQIGRQTMEFNKQVALGEPVVKKTTAETRNWQEGLDRTQAALKKLAEEAGKAGGKIKQAKPPEATEWDKWTQSLEKAIAELAIAPLKLQYLNDQLAQLAASGDTSSARFQALKKAADDLAASLDPVAAAMKRFADESAEAANVPLVMAAITRRMDELAASGRMVTLEFKLLGDQLAKLQEQQDVTGATRLVNELMEAEQQASYLQAKFDAINTALEKGFITQASADRAKNALLGISDAADKTIEKTKTLSQSVAEMGAKFVTDFADKLIDSLGKADMAFSDLIESMLKQVAKLMLNNYFQQFLKLAQGEAGTGSMLGWFGSLIGAAKGAAFNGRGLQFMAKGGVVTQPTMFAHGGGLGVMGERGAEAIVPLARDSSGNLGVSASPVVINVQNNADATVTTSSSDNVDGQRVIDITIERKVKSMFASGAMDRTMRSAFGATRQPAAG